MKFGGLGVKKENQKNCQRHLWMVPRGWDEEIDVRLSSVDIASNLVNCGYCSHPWEMLLKVG